MVLIAFLRRLLGTPRPAESVETRAAHAPLPPEVFAPEPETQVACPNCGSILDPPPDHTRLCPSCRHRIVVRHSGGHAIYLTEAAVEIFERERQLDIERQAWTRERRRWLQLARLAGAPADLRRSVAVAPLSIAAVQSSRTLYINAAERAVRAARRDKHWEEVARIRRREAAALFEETGGSLPPSDEILALYREGVAATLRALATVSRDAELVGASCCHPCRSDNERIFRIADELRTPRLPHAGCPRGLCACDWWPALRDRPTKKRRRRPSTASPAAAVAGADSATAADHDTSGAEIAEDEGAKVVVAGQHRDEVSPAAEWFPWMEGLAPVRV